METPSNVPPARLNSGPRFKLSATRRLGFGLPRAARIEIYDESIHIYSCSFRLRREGVYSLVRRAKFSEVTGCEYIAPTVRSSRLTLGGFAWAQMPGEIELSISAPVASSDRVEGEAAKRAEHLRFGGGDLTPEEFQGLYSWLVARLNSARQVPGMSTPV